jgi:hypothetical protein
MSGNPLKSDGEIDRRKILKAIGVTAAAGAAIGTASAGDCWTETEYRDHRC